nr:methyltransferase domain-containing protein [Knoellia sp. DB2414S]
MGVGYAAQLAEKDAHVRAVLTEVVTPGAWTDPFSSRENGFRNKAKLVVGGRRGSPVLGILDDDSRVVDLTRCGLYEPGLHEAVLRLPQLVGEIGLTPYDVATRNGELKHLLVTHSPDGELMLRFVLRSEGQLRRLREHLPTIQRVLPTAKVVTANLLPEHKALLEGDEEVVLSPEATLPMQVNGIRLHLRPRSFFQTNTEVAAGLYRQAQDWLSDTATQTLWDLYCGVGGFALHAMTAATAPQRVVGIEVSADAVASAELSTQALASRKPLPQWVFHAGDATAYAHDNPAPDTVLVNPPRRGIGTDLSHWLESSRTVQRVLYSSCNAESLARDLGLMPSLKPIRARLFDMFPQTRHHEVLVLLERG